MQSRPRTRTRQTPHGAPSSTPAAPLYSSIWWVLAGRGGTRLLARYTKTRLSALRCCIIPHCHILITPRLSKVSLPMTNAAETCAVACLTHVPRRREDEITQ
ncbi:hypothetical protein DPSP01_010269 [Paraphaeosphaeria sporulosa]